MLGLLAVLAIEALFASSCGAKECGFKREIEPKLDAFSLKEIAAATGLSLAACSRIRAGARAPHPRHWEALRALVEAGNGASAPNLFCRQSIVGGLGEREP